ncbi:MAG: hypothetical protein IT215_07145 [Chitinophagaceae bacterium]|nr:hypothetical protein [Chitinophagaceae bacterium]
MSKGFIVTKLVLVGPQLQPAIVDFKKGLNVISGPTNTGKTFIFECLDFMMGASKLDRIVSQAKGYQTVFLEIESSSKRYTLERAIKGGDFKLYNCKYADIINTTPSVISSKHSKDDNDSASAFLLKLNNLLGKEIRSNDKGAKRTLSYRDICHLLLVDENQIITKGSPLASDNFITRTPQLNAVKLIVSGIDDNAIITKQTAKVINSKKGKIELLDEIILKIKDSNPLLKDGNNISTELESIDKMLNFSKEAHNKLLVEFTDHDTKRSSISKNKHKKEEYLIDLQETLSRSTLLKEYYDSDVKRLKSTIEAGVLLSENNTNSRNCPYCSSDIKSNVNPIEITQTINACEKEIEKISILVQELNKTVQLINAEKEAVNKEIADYSKELMSIENYLDANINKKLNDYFDQINTLNEKKNKLLVSKYQENSISEYVSFKNSLSLAVKQPKEKGSYDALSASLMQPISNTILKILKDCNYNKFETVTFSESNMDFVLGNEDRKLFGKGFRAITYAIVILALTENTKSKDYTISIPIFDSPLVTYSKPKADGEGIAKDLAMDFYRYCANISTCDQIIIFENEVPPLDIAEKMHHIVFTDIKGDGRQGFIPIS